MFSRPSLDAFDARLRRVELATEPLNPTATASSGLSFRSLQLFVVLRVTRGSAFYEVLLNLHDRTAQLILY